MCSVVKKCVEIHERLKCMGRILLFWFCFHAPAVFVLTFE